MKLGASVGLGCCVLVGIAAFTRPAAAQTAPEPGCTYRCGTSVREIRSGGYFAAHGSALGVLALATLITGNAFPASPPAVRAVAPPARSVADATLALEVVLPAPALLSTMNNGETFDAVFTYAQVLTTSELADHALRKVGLDSSASFAFGAAVSSAYLFDQTNRVDWRVQGAFWGVQLGLATSNMMLNVRGGRSKLLPSLLGASIGSGLAVLAQLVHGGQDRLIPSAVIGLDERNPQRHHDLTDHVWVASLVGIAAGVAIPLTLLPPAHFDPNLDYEVVPTAFGVDGGGLMFRGKL